MRVRAHGLGKVYPGVDGAPPVRVLDDINLDAEPGQVLAVVGQSGSGKSTLLNLLGLLEPVGAGEIRFDEARVSHLGRRAQCRVRGTQIGYVFQTFLLLASLTALDNVLLAARYVGRERREAERDALALMERLGVLHRRGHYPAQLSGGEQQRVAYCRAVLNRPPLLLADEPTGNLDDMHARVILDELRAQARERGATVILVTHRLDAAATADACLRLAAGRLASD